MSRAWVFDTVKHPPERHFPWTPPGERERRSEERYPPRREGGRRPGPVTGPRVTLTPIELAAEIGSSHGGFPTRPLGLNENLPPARRVRLRTTREISIGTEVAEGTYRYLLTRRWSCDPLLAFVMVNPNSADATTDDPTIRRCIGFARREGAGGIAVLNLYALRSLKPVGLLDHPDPEGPYNQQSWAKALSEDQVGAVVAAWGTSAPRGLPPSHALETHRSQEWLCLGRTADGSPRHPLYARADTPLQSWPGAD